MGKQQPSTLPVLRMALTFHRRRPMKDNHGRTSRLCSEAPKLETSQCSSTGWSKAGQPRAEAEDQALHGVVPPHLNPIPGGTP